MLSFLRFCRPLHLGIIPTLIASLLLAGCSSGHKEPRGDTNRQMLTVVTLKGSDTMVLLCQRWSEKFREKNGGIDVQVSGGGSGTGIAALTNGSTDIASASRTMKDSEKKTIAEKYGTEVVEIPVARDGVVIYVHEGNPVDSLTLKQADRIYRGEITNWKDVGGRDEQIILYGRENSSGTYEFFKEHVLKKRDFAAITQTLQGTAAIINAVRSDENGIGYGGGAYAHGVKQLRIASDSGAAVSPTEENVKSGAYPLSRSLYLYLRQEPTGAAKEFIDWVLSPEGQNYTHEMGYFPVK